jgi:hypothetical protein
MKATLFSLVLGGMLLGGAQLAAAADLSGSASPSFAMTTPLAQVDGVLRAQPVGYGYGYNGWRYRWYGNRWWYWTPNNSWVYWYGDQWVPYGGGVTVYNYGAPYAYYGAPYRYYTGYRGPYYRPYPYYYGRRYYGRRWW